MLDIQKNKRQGASGGLSSRPSQISLIRRDESVIRRELNRSSSPPSNLSGMSADAAERRSNVANNPKPTPNLRGMSADAAERWSNAANKPKPTPNLGGISADAAERRSNKPKPASNLRGMSADAAERWSNSANSRGTYNIQSGDTLSAIAKRELGSSSRWREIKKADGSAFTESDAGRLQIGQQVHLPGTSGSSNNSSGQPSNLRGMSADAAERRSLGSNPQPQLAIAPRGEQSYNNALTRTNGVVTGIAVGSFVASRKLQLPQSYPPLPAQAQSHNSSSRRARPAFVAVGEINEKAWAEVNQSVEKAGKITGYSNNKRAWRDLKTGKALEPRRFPDAHFENVQTGEKLGAEYKSSSAAAELPNAARQRALDTNAIKIGASVEGVRLDRVVYVEGLPVNGPGGNIDKALGRSQTHIFITPQGGAEPLPSTWTERVKLLGGYKKSPPHLESRVANTTLSAARSVGESRAASVALRGVSRVAAPVAVGIDAWRLGSAYQKDGFGQEFRETAGSVAGGWGGAAAGAAIGSFAGPPGMIVGGIIGGFVGSEFGDDIEQGAEKAGQAIAGGAKKAWNEVFG